MSADRTAPTVQSSTLNASAQPPPPPQASLRPRSRLAVVTAARANSSTYGSRSDARRPKVSSNSPSPIPRAGRCPSWTAGAHVDLSCDPSLTRQYSLCGSAADESSWKVGVLRDPNSRGGSAYVHEKLAEVPPSACADPRNHFPLVPSPRYLFIAGGIGITPILAMIARPQAARRRMEPAVRRSVPCDDGVPRRTPRPTTG